MQYLVEQCIDLSLRSCVKAAELVSTQNELKSEFTQNKSIQLTPLNLERNVNVSALNLTYKHEKLLNGFIVDKIAIHNELMRVMGNFITRDKFQTIHDVAYKVQLFNNVVERTHEIVMCHVFKFVSPNDENNEIHVVKRIYRSWNISGFSLIG